jgi:hypothetical protein
VPNHEDRPSAIESPEALIARTKATIHAWQDALYEVADDQRVRVTRTLVIDGPASWVRRTLTRAMVQDVGASKVEGLSCIYEEIEILPTEDERE